MLAQSSGCWQSPAAPDGLIMLVQGHPLVGKASVCSVSAPAKQATQRCSVLETHNRVASPPQDEAFPLKLYRLFLAL